MSDEKTRVSIVGLGKLGVPMAVAFSAKGHWVIGVDTYQPVVDAVNRGLSPIFEPGVQSMLESFEGRLRATQDAEEVVVHPANDYYDTEEVKVLRGSWRDALDFPVRLISYNAL